MRILKLSKQRSQQEKRSKFAQEGSQPLISLGLKNRDHCKNIECTHNSDSNRIDKNREYETSALKTSDNGNYFAYKKSEFQETHTISNSLPAWWGVLLAIVIVLMLGICSILYQKVVLDHFMATRRSIKNV